MLYRYNKFSRNWAQHSPMPVCAERKSAFAHKKKPAAKAGHYSIWGEHCEIKTIKVMIVFMSQAMRLFVVRKAFALPIQQI